jgi:hypothetical protein
VRAGFMPSTVNSYLLTLGAFLNWLIAEGALTESPVDEGPQRADGHVPAAREAARPTGGLSGPGPPRTPWSLPGKTAIPREPRSVSRRLSRSGRGLSSHRRVDPPGTTRPCVEKGRAVPLLHFRSASRMRLAAVPVAPTGERKLTASFVTVTRTPTPRRPIRAGGQCITAPPR